MMQPDKVSQIVYRCGISSNESTEQKYSVQNSHHPAINPCTVTFNT